MTKKDFELIARNVARGLSENWSPACPNMLDATELAHNLADELQADNPRFDRDRFLEACGV